MKRRAYVTLFICASLAPGPVQSAQAGAEGRFKKIKTLRVPLYLNKILNLVEQ